MGNCGSLNVRQSAMIETWTDREIRHGPAGCYCYAPCVNTVHVLEMAEIKMFEYALLEDQRDPGNTKYIYGPQLFKLENGYQTLNQIQKMPVLDQNDYIVVTDRTGVKRTVPGPTVYQPTWGEVWTEVKEALVVQMNEYIVIKNGAEVENPIRHLRGPTKYYPQPYDDVLEDETQKKRIRKCHEVNDTQALWVKRADGRIYLIDRPQFFMMEVGEAIDKVIAKTILKESEFCIIISPTGENILKTGRSEKDRAFFLPPYHSFLLFSMGIHTEGVNKDKPLTFDRFSILPTYIPSQFVVRTSENVQVKVDLRISFQIFQPELYVVKPIDFHSQIRYWVQNDLLDAYAKVTFREFLRTYADISVDATQRSHTFFNEFGIQILDVQVINFVCESNETQKLLEMDIVTNVTKQNELRAKETDVEIMKKEKAIRMEQKDIEFQYAEKENEMALKKKELDVVLRQKEVELQIQEERRRMELTDIKRQNAVKEGSYEGQAQGESVKSFFESLPTSIPVTDKLQIWATLRDMERSAMLYSKVNDISIMPPGADIRKFSIQLDEGGKKAMREQPLLLPSILGYSSDQNNSQQHTIAGGTSVGKAFREKL